MMHEASTSSDHTFTNSSHNRSHGWFSSPMVYRLPSDDPVTHEDHEFESMPPSVCFEHIWEEEGDQRESCNEYVQCSVSFELLQISWLNN